MNWVSGILLLIPFLVIRFGLLAILNPQSIQRAAYFAPVRGKERVAYYIYQICNAWIFLYLFFLTIKTAPSWQFYLGLLCYLLGLCLCTITIINFSSPDDRGLNINGIYKYSRNPMYVAYFICFLGMTLITQSLILLIGVVIFQISAHWIILTEERWCIEKFGAIYKLYMRSVRRYI